ncbi:hypothetical protein N9L47_03295 [Rhodobacteraceae bacterium]|nr:hypothetical protein [Paracoccaceae bacterium]
MLFPRRDVFIPGVVIVLALVFAFSLPKPAATEDDVSTVVAAISKNFEGSRYDSVSVSLEQCVLTVSVDDSTACRKGAQYRGWSSSLDLGEHDIKFWDKYAREVGSEWRFRVELTVTSEWTQRYDAMRSLAERESARAEAKYGKGLKARVEASKAIQRQNRLEGLPSHGLTNHCNRPKSVGPFVRPVFVQTPDVKGLKSAFLRIVEECKASK